MGESIIPASATNSTDITMPTQSQKLTDQCYNIELLVKSIEEGYPVGHM
ncbi:MAG TPA: hypothetical protein VH500_12140 [Nitrososphaeraceae archaeon]